MALQDILNLNAICDIFSYVEIGNRLKDEEGNNIKFKIKPLSYEEFGRLKKKATIIGKDGSQIIDEARLNMLCIIESTLEPSFKDISSLEKMKVNTPEQYLNKVLLSGEVENLIREILKISGFLEDMEGFVSDIKN